MSITANGSANDAVKTPWSLAVLITSFVVINLGFIIFFWLIRVPYLNDKNYAKTVPDGRVGSNGLNRWSDSLFISIAIQTTLGSNTDDLVAFGTSAKWMNAIQAMTTLASWIAIIGVAAIYVGKRHHDARAQLERVKQEYYRTLSNTRGAPRPPTSMM